MPNSTSQQQTILIRKAVENDAAAIVQVNYDAVHVTAVKDYDQATIDDWSFGTTSNGNELIEARINNPDSTALVAEIDGIIAGFGDVDPSNRELRSLYVSPLAGGKGIGRALLQELEAVACKQGLTELWLNSSLTAEGFYSARGYVNDGQIEHHLPSGRKMICLKMHKKLVK